MKKKKITLIICICLAALGLLAIIFVAIISRATETKISEDLKLKAPNDRILYSQEVDDIKCDDNGINCVTAGKISQYLYVSDKEAPPENYNGLQEDISKRTSNAQFFYQGEKDGQEQWVAKFYPEQPFYKDEEQNKWYQTETATTTVTAFNQQTKLTFWEKLLGKRALADTFYSGAGDGRVAESIVGDGNWDNVHNALTGSEALPTTTPFRVSSDEFPGQSTYNINRGFIPFDTSALPDTAVITSSTLYLYITSNTNTDNDGNDFFVVVQTSQPGPTTLTTADFDLCGSVNNPTEGSNRLDATGRGTSIYWAWTLDSDGIGWIKKTLADPYTMLGLREGHDVLNDPITLDTNNQIRPSSSEQAGTSQDPYLTVTYYYHRTVINSPQTNFMTSGLVGNWTFNGPDINNTTNSAYDRSSSYATGTMINMATSSRAVPGINGQAFSFDGVNDYVKVDHTAALEITGDLTISVWVNKKTSAGGDGLVNKGLCYGTVCPFGLRTDSSAQVIFYQNDGTAGSQEDVVTSATALVSNTWYHVVAVRSGTSVSLYINGVLNAGPTTYTRTPTASGDNFTIGTENGLIPTSNPVHGNIDEVRVYNRALTPSEVEGLYKAGAARLTVNTPAGSGASGLSSGLAGYWSFDGSAMGTTSATDLSGNSNTGWLNNGVNKAIGKLGQGLSFDGVDDYVWINDAASLTPSSAITISFWINFNAEAGDKALVQKWGALGQRSWSMATDWTVGYTDEFYMSVSSDGTANWFVGSTNANLGNGTWYHIVATYNGTNILLYKNGVLLTSRVIQGANPGSIFNNTVPMIIGAFVNGSGVPNAVIDEVRIYSRALSASEIQQLYQQGTRTLKFSQ